MPGRIVTKQALRIAVQAAIGEMYCRPQDEVVELIRDAATREDHPQAKDVLETLLINAELGAREQLPVCQDTGLLIVFAELGKDLTFEGGTLREQIEIYAASAWKKYYLRDSIAWDPLRGKLNPTPTPKVIQPDLATQIDEGCPLPPLPVILHTEQVPGDTLTLHFALKGGGSENCSALRMFEPTAELREIGDYIVDTVVKSGGRPCPPLIVGVGIGGDFELSAIMAKKALVIPREAGSVDPYLRTWELNLLGEINAKGKGAQGLGGRTTALDLRVLTTPCHIASLPVAVNIECHAHRCCTKVI